MHPLLQEKSPAVGARLEQSKHKPRVGVLAENHDAQPRVSFPELGGGLDALVGVRGRHADVRYHDVGAFRLYVGEQFIEVAEDTHNLDA